MPIPTNVFKNILRLEEHKGFTDAAVQGGLEAFARRWAEQLGDHEQEARPIAEAIVTSLGGYAASYPEARQGAVQQAGELLSLFERGVRDLPPHLNGKSTSSNGNGNGYLPSTIEDFTGFDDMDPRAKAPVSSFRSGIAPAPLETPPSAVGRAARRNADLDSPVTVLRGVQDANARLLKRLGVYTVRDALLFFPFRYDDFSDMKPIAELVPEVNQTIVATIWEVEARRTRTG